MLVVAHGIAIALAYGIGTLPTAILVGGRRGHDPTTEGSGNPGATNVYRTAGRRAGATVLVIDVLKGGVPAAAGWLLVDRTFGLFLGASAVLGHIFPAQRRFVGGKGVATAAGAALAVYPLMTVALALVFAAVAKLSRTASVASIVISLLWPLGVWAQGRPAAEIVVSGSLGLLVVARHGANIRRLVSRSEPRLGT